MNTFVDEDAAAPLDSLPGAEVWLNDNADLVAPYLDRRPLDLAGEVDADRSLLRILYDAGLSRQGWPIEAGGSGGTEIDRARFYDALARADVALPEAFVLLETLAPVLTRYAPELAARHLPAYLRGEEMWGQGFSEPEAGSDLAAMRARGVVAGDTVTVSGQKVWTTLGQFAQWAMVLCRTDPDSPAHRGLSMLWIDLASPGVEVRAIRAANGRDEFAEMFFDDVRVPIGNVIGGLGRGWEIAMYLLQFERGMYAWERQAVLHRTLRHGVARGRRATPDAVAAVGRAFTTLTALRTCSARTVRRLAAGETLGPAASVDKILLSRAEKQTHEALRLLDRAGFLTDDDPLTDELRERWFYSRATSIFGGAVEIQRTIVAEHLLGLPREARGGR